MTPRQGPDPALHRVAVVLGTLMLVTLLGALVIAALEHGLGP